MDELPHVPWTYRTTPRRSTGKTPFSTLRTDQFSDKENNCLLSTNLELVEERREVAAVKMAHYQQKLKQGYDKGMKLRPLAPRDLV